MYPSPRPVGSLRLCAIGALVAVTMLCACTSARLQEEGGFSEIDVVAAAACGEPGAFIRELRDARSKKLKAGGTPLRVPAGVYSIGVSCAAPQKIASAACTDQSATPSRSDVPAYELVLEPGKRYVFSCARVKDQDSVRLSQSAI